VRDGGTLATQAAGLYSLRNLGAIGQGLDAALVRTLADNPPLFSRRAPGDASDYGRTIYSVYYSGLCLVTSPDNIWRPWNDAMKRELLALQCRSGGADGSWPPIGRDAEQAGRQYMTAMAVLSLEVYYRFTPSLKAGADPLRVSSPKPEPVTDVTEPSELAVLLRSQDMRVRREAAREICRRKDASALPALLAAIRAERTSAKRLMVQDLTAFGDRPELPGELVALLDDDGVRDVVMKVLSTVTGETHATAEAWTAWWATQKR
ncbi:MAG: hypothetical protein HUU15_09290, partial [Candidatus Brocadiae bacterium]|nr:hypothetical protein [Candidatus Brocadiia bacterium]